MRRLKRKLLLILLTSLSVNGLNGCATEPKLETLINDFMGNNWWWKIDCLLLEVSNPIDKSRGFRGMMMGDRRNLSFF